jgi:outer membrane protein OmpA-like peptidoglycan-associated protein
MNRSLIVLIVGISFGAAAVPPILAQGVQRSEAIASSDILSQISMFNYREGPKSDVIFRPTPIATNGEGEAEVEYEDGNARISVKVDNLPAPTSLGPYTTYVLWALTPDGRAANQGVLTSFEGGQGELNTSYGASQFALIVTAEPHFAVSAPSTMVALYNVADDVEGEESRVTTLAERAQYTNLASIAIDNDANPVEVVQARYAIAIAEAAGAERFAPQPYNAARQRLTMAETALAGGRKQRKTAVDAAREAVVAGEDARRSAMLASAEATAEAERAAAAAAATAAERERSDLAAAAAAEQASRAATTAADAASRAATAEATAQAREDLRRRLEAALPTRETDRGLVSEISGLQFATGTADLDASAQVGLSRFAGIVASYPTLSFNVEGHTDSTGSAATNAELSLRRAEAVRTFLITQGVAASRIEVEGFGPSRPAADNSTAEGRARNRRVEIVLSGGPLALSAL